MSHLRLLVDCERNTRVTLLNTKMTYSNNTKSPVLKWSSKRFKNVIVLR